MGKAEYFWAPESQFPGSPLFPEGCGLEWPSVNPGDLHLKRGRGNSERPSHQRPCQSEIFEGCGLQYPRR